MAELTYGDIYRILRGSWIAIVTFTLAGAVLAVAIATLMKPIYRAEVLLSPAVVENSAGSALSRLAEQIAPISAVLGNSEGGLLNRDVRIAALRSRRLTESFVRERNLLPVLFPDEWDSATGNWKLRHGKPAPPSMDDAFRLFDEDVRAVSEDRRTGLVTLRIEWPDPRTAADWSNDLVARANEFLRQQVIREAQRSIAFLENELSKTSVVERRQIIYRLIESKTAEIMMANARTGYAFLVIDPAVVSDRDNYVRPRRAIIFVVGIVLGLFTGIVYASVRWLRRSTPTRLT